MENPFGSDFRWENLSEEEKQVLRAKMHARLTEPDLSMPVISEAEESSEVLSKEDIAVRLFTASNPNTPAPVLHQLARSKSPAILERVAENPRAHQATLTGLASHSHCDVRAAVAENSNTPLEIVRQLASDDNPDVRYRLAENHNTPVEILRLLEDDSNPYVACRAQTTLSRLYRDNLIESRP